MGLAQVCLNYVLFVNYLFSPTVDPPKVTRQPESKTIETGASTTFTVEASGDGLQFKWERNGKGLHDASKHCGTKTHTLHIKHVDKSDMGSYQCLVKNDLGRELSDEVVLTVSKLFIVADVMHLLPAKPTF